MKRPSRPTRRSWPSRTSWLARHAGVRPTPLSTPRKPLPTVNAKRQARRRKAYKAAIGSVRFRKLRLQRFALDGWRCTEVIQGQRCGFVDETETGTDLVAEHTTCARFGHELIEDLRTRCRWCDRRGTPLERFNHRGKSA